MSRRQKRLHKLRQNPTNVSFEALKQVLEDYGFEHVRTAGSHHTFIAEIDDQNWRITVPFRRPVKIVYVRTALSAIDEIIALTGATEGEDSGGDTDD